MSTVKNIVLTLGGVATATALFISASTAAQTGGSYANGQCKQGYEAIVGPSVPAAQAMWTAMVASKHGNKWANWVGAKSKAVTPISATQFQARGKPCYYEPVM